jgi:hypothetical protein
MSTPEEDEAWRSIVDNYGDRPDFPEGSARRVERPALPEPAPPARQPEPPDHPELLEHEGDHFVPQEAPPVALPRGRRGVAWAGLFGVPVLVLLSIALSIHVPGWVSFLLLVWFVGGFVYLVATMSDKPTDGWDDGAVV